MTEPVQPYGGIDYLRAKPITTGPSACPYQVKRAFSLPTARILLFRASAARWRHGATQDAYGARQDRRARGTRDTTSSGTCAKRGEGCSSPMKTRRRNFRLIVETMRVQIRLGERRLTVSTSVGLAMYTGNADTTPPLLAKRADEALYAAKAAVSGRQYVAASVLPACDRGRRFMPSSAFL